MKKALILGANGYIGYHLAEKMTGDYHVLGSARRPDLLPVGCEAIPFRLDEIGNILREKRVDLIINCIAMANVDRCEKEPELARSTNVELVKSLVELVNSTDSVKLVHFSSNAVYSGTAPPYSEQAPRNPTNSYGVLKAEADDLVIGECRRYLIVRAMTVYGPTLPIHRPNPASMIIERLIANEPLKLVDDVFCNFLYLDDLTEATKQLIDLDASAEFNIAGPDVASRYELGKIICKQLGLPTNRLTRVDSKAFGNLAARGSNTSFDIRKLRNKIEYQPHSISDAVAETLTRMTSDRTPGRNPI